MKIAVIGSGISGLVSSYVLQRDHEVTLFEANSYLGGHTHTVDVELENEKYAVDTGFIVFNNKTYPLFIRFLEQLGVSWKNTEMSFSVSDEKTGFEYNGNNLNTLFAQRRNILNPKFYHFVGEILRFNKKCKELEFQDNIPKDQTLGEFLNENGFSRKFQNYYVLPMAAAIWSSTYSEVADFSLYFFIRFFSNHGLLNINDRPQWYVIDGGSREYVRALGKRLSVDIRMNCPVKSIGRTNQGVEIYSGDKKEEFDEVIIACHSDQALELLQDPSPEEQHVLSEIPYQKNQVTLHTDARLLPKRSLAWASWNYRMNNTPDRNELLASVSYNMNILQGISSKETFVVSLNQNEKINPKKILRQFEYAHPVFNSRSEKAKKLRSQICGARHTHFCGAYWYNGFHEDGVRAALDVTRRFGAEL